MKESWRELLAMLVGTAIVLAIVMMVGQCSDDENSNQKDLITKEQIRIAQEKEKFEITISELTTEIKEIHKEISLLRTEINQSIIQRQEAHDAMDDAGTMDDIDRLIGITPNYSSPGITWEECTP